MYGESARRHCGKDHESRRALVEESFLWRGHGGLVTDDPMRKEATKFGQHESVSLAYRNGGRTIALFSDASISSASVHLD